MANCGDWGHAPQTLIVAWWFITHCSLAGWAVVAYMLCVAMGKEVPCSIPMFLGCNGFNLVVAWFP